MTIKRYITSAFLLLVISFSSFAFSPIDPTNIKDSRAVEEIATMITNMNLDVDKETKLMVHFLINSANEVIVLETDNEDLDVAITDKLNYKKIKDMDLKKNTVYILPVRFE